MILWSSLESLELLFHFFSQHPPLQSIRCDSQWLAEMFTKRGMYESFIHVILRHDHRLPSSLSETSTDVSPEAIATVNKMKLIVTLRKN